MWRCECFHRMDNSYNEGWFCRLWRNTGDLFIENKPGLHQRLVPPNLGPEGRSDIQILHYGFASDEAILRKYHDYKAHGQSGWALDRLIDERSLRVANSKPEWFRKEITKYKLNDIFGTPIASKV